METTIKINTIRILMIGSLFLLPSCVSEEGPFFEDITLEDVSFSTDVQPIFNSRCIQCHDDSHSTGLDLRSGMSYDLLVNVVSANYAPNIRIVPMDTTNSVLWNKINDTGVFGGPMPPVGSLLSNFEIEKIESWIEQGALNN